MNIEEAKKASRNGAIAAFISGAMTIAIVAFAITSDADGQFAPFNDPLNIIDVFMIFGCAIGLLRYSRAAALIIFVYFILSKIYIAAETGAITGIPVGLIFVYFYGKAVQGTFTYHKLRKAEDENYRAAPKWAYFVGIPLVVLLTLLIGIGMLSMTDVIPSTEVLTGDEVSESDLQELIDNNVLFADETIEYLYSYGLLSVMEGGNILSNRAAITYYVDENGDLQIYEMPFADITAVYRMVEGGVLEDSIYMVSSDDEDYWMTIELSVENKGDEVFVAALRKKVQLAKSMAEEEAVDNPD